MGRRGKYCYNYGIKINYKDRGTFLCLSYKSVSAETPSVYSTTVASGSTTYQSDFVESRHALYSGTYNTSGRKLASVLNIYGCVPLYGAYSQYYYNLLADIDITNGFAVLEAFLNKDFSATEFEVPSTSNFDHIWNEIADNNDIFVETNKLQVLEKNLKQRFPVVVKTDNTYSVISEYTVGEYTESSFDAVFDTALYLTVTALNAQTVISDVNVYTNDAGENILEITKTAPSVNNTVSALLYGGGSSRSYTEGTDALPEWVVKSATTYIFTAKSG